MSVAPTGHSLVSVPNSPSQLARLAAIRRHGAVGLLRHVYTVVLDIEGPLDDGVLSAALAHLVVRHPVLRAAFHLDGHEHRIQSDAQLPLRRRVVAGNSMEQRLARALDLAYEDQGRPFTPDTAPLARATVLGIDRERRLLVLSFDHLIMDAWSAGTVVDELIMTADRLSTGDTVPAEPSSAYLDARHTAERWLRSPAGRALCAERRRTLAGCAERLPFDGAPDAAITDGFSTANLALPAAVSIRLTDLQRRTRGGLLAIGLTALSILAAADRGRQHPMVCSSFACRETVAEESAVGCLSNPVAVRLPEPTLTGLEAIRWSRQELIEVLSVQRMPSPAQAYRRGGDGLSASVQYLPAALVSAEHRASRIGRARVRLCPLSTCPTGADVDLFMLERPAATYSAAHRGLVLTAMAEPVRVGSARLDALLREWGAALNRLTLDAELTQTLRVSARRL
jgi:hypothetical protein